MADIVVTAANIGVLYPDDAAEIYNGIAAVALTAGQLVYFNSSGKLALSNAGAAGTAVCHGIVLQACSANGATSILKRGHIGGFTVSAMAYNDTVYASDTAGASGTAAGTVSLVVGKVVPITLDASGSPTKTFYFAAPSWGG